MDFHPIYVFAGLLGIAVVLFLFINLRFSKKSNQAIKNINDNFTSLSETIQESIKEPEVKNQLELLTDEDVIELIQSRVLFLESYEQPSEHYGKIQLKGHVIRNFDSPMSERVYPLTRLPKKERSDVLKIHFKNGKFTEYSAVYEKSFRYADFFKWFYSTDNPYFHFTHEEGFTTIVRDNIDGIEFKKVYVEIK